MTGTFQLYRKAIAALIGGVVPLLASVAPGIGDYLDPVTANKIDGANVIGLARVVIDTLDRIDDKLGGNTSVYRMLFNRFFGRKISYRYL